LLKILVRKIAIHTKNRRFLDLEKKIKFKRGHQMKMPKIYTDPHFVERKGLDKDFRKFGIKVANFFEDQPERKLKTMKRIYFENDWLKYRALIGPAFPTAFVSFSTHKHCTWSQGQGQRVPGV